jgi:hypothetical protein
VLVGSVDAEHVVVLDAGETPRFVEQLPRRARASGARGAADLQSDVALQSRIEGAVDLSEPAHPDPHADLQITQRGD